MKEKINSLLKKAMMSKDAKTLSILRVLKGEIERIEKGSNNNVTDSDVIKIAKKLSDSIKETGGSEDELVVLAQFIPEPLSEQEISQLVTNIILDNGWVGQMSNMKNVMNYMNENYAGRFDGKLVSDRAKHVISGSE